MKLLVLILETLLVSALFLFLILIGLRFSISPSAGLGNIYPIVLFGTFSIVVPIIFFVVLISGIMRLTMDNSGKRVTKPKALFLIVTASILIIEIAIFIKQVSDSPI